MGRLDRYIARQYLINTIALLVIVFGFVVTIDVSINLSRFISNAREASGGTGEDGSETSTVRTGLLTVLVIVDLWWPRLLHLFNYISGLVLVAAMGFTCTQLVRNREMIALLAAGQSLHRVMRPLMAVAAGVMVLQIANQELLIPRIAPLLAREHGEAYRRGLGVQPAPLTSDGVGLLIHASAFDADNGILRDVFMIERDEQAEPVRVIRAEEAVWRDGGWDLVGGFSESRRPTATGVRPEPQPVERVETSLDPTRLKMQTFSVVRQALSFQQLGRMLSRPELLDERAEADLQRLRWGRFSVVLSNLLALLIAAPFFLTRVPTDFIGRTLRCAPLASAALLGGVFGASAALPGVPAVLGVFIPVVVLLPLAIGAVGSIKT